MPRVLINVAKDILFTVDSAVGRNAPNDRLDVLLVQFLLFLSTNSLWWVPVDSQPNPPKGPRGLRVATLASPAYRALGTTLSGTHPKPQGEIIIDGICGDQTIGFIEYFQEQMQLVRVGHELSGQVVPMGPGGTKTIDLLNEVVRRSSGRPWMLDQSSAYPKELSNSFYF